MGQWAPGFCFVGEIIMMKKISILSLLLAVFSFVSFAGDGKDCSAEDKDKKTEEILPEIEAKDIEKKDEAKIDEEKIADEEKLTKEEEADKEIKDEEEKKIDDEKKD